MAEDELIEIVPNLRMDPLNFICGDFGPNFMVPFRADSSLSSSDSYDIQPVVKLNKNESAVGDSLDDDFPKPSPSNPTHHTGHETFYKVFQSWASRKFMSGWQKLLKKRICVIFLLKESMRKEISLFQRVVGSQFH